MQETEKQALRGSVLLVEDEDLLRWSVKSFLEARDFVVEDVSSGKLAFEKLTSACYDIVVTDLMIKGFSGLDLTAYVQKNCPHSQVIIITGKGSKESAIKAFRHGVYDYIEKPFDLELLLIVIEKAIEKVKMTERLVQLSRTDGLTGLYNQRYFYEVLETEINRSRRQTHPVSLILADVDCFKEYNDKYGHLEGDEALVKIAACLKEACRQDVDMIFRYGGDEFMIILPEAHLGTARDVSNRIKSMSTHLDIDSITLSIGLAELGDGEDIKSFIRRADKAMYAAKQSGGNKAVVLNGA